MSICYGPIQLDRVQLVTARYPLWQAAFLTYACGIKAPQLPCLGAGPLGSVTLVSHYPYGLSPGLNLINLDIILVGRKSLE
jgi:hypothetical protein